MDDGIEAGRKCAAAVRSTFDFLSSSNRQFRTAREILCSDEKSEMREEGLEPSRLAAQEPKSCVSAIPPLSLIEKTPRTSPLGRG